MGSMGRDGEEGGHGAGGRWWRKKEGIEEEEWREVEEGSRRQVPPLSRSPAYLDAHPCTLSLPIPSSIPPSFPLGESPCQWATLNFPFPHAELEHVFVSVSLFKCVSLLNGQRPRAFE